MTRAGMHQTTVRFGADLWAALEREAAHLGLSTAQYIRDAALARLAFTEGFERGSARLPAWMEHGRGELEHRVLGGPGKAAAAGAHGAPARERALSARGESNQLGKEKEWPEP